MNPGPAARDIGARVRPGGMDELLARCPLYAIVDTAARPEMSPLNIVESLLRAGVTVVQYRHKGPLRRSHYDECCAIADKVREAGGCFIVNDRADVAALCGAHGVHLGQDDLPPEKARAFLPAGMLVGYSTHNLEQVRDALHRPVDYIAVGPIFTTSSKKNPDPVVGLNLLGEARSMTNRSLVAIGGITLENAPSVLQAGATAVAVIRDLLCAPDVEQRAREFMEKFGTR
jgi:thiamine-phosphate pyrophosphorylase